MKRPSLASSNPVQAPFIYQSKNDFIGGDAPLGRDTTLEKITPSPLLLAPVMLLEG
jgi:hypothetical protein